ncbi:MAG: hypothetical protein JRI23_09615, partial [Deltaproteobacteria bacterium]|nr:hypothetical protein [Deltaproteobacteria bacterium]MBW2531912.1 hypothetical protein [Deltaproteobacteria bacterium]
LADPRQRLPFYPVALAGDRSSHAYWVVKGKLVRRPIAADGAVGALEELAKDAASGTIVAALRAPGSPARDVAVYVRGEENEQGERGAGLWIEGAGAQKLSQISGGTTGLALAPLAPGKLELVVLDGRSAMSSVHAVDLTLAGDGPVGVGEDRVVYVAGGVEWHTCPQLISIGASPVALLPVAKDISHFGLVSLLIPAGAGQASESWVDYANGVDPAPVAVATICGKPMVALVRPEKPGPGATLLVQLGQLDGAGKIIGLRTVAAAGIVSHLALGAAGASGGKVPGGSGHAAGWLAYSTDAGLWAKALVCSGSS